MTKMDLPRADDRQGLLFHSTPEETANRIGLNWLALTELHERDFLSFDLEAGLQLSETQEAELTFLGSLVSAGCDERMLRLLLKDLDKPYCYKIGPMYFDWTERRWLSLPEEKEDPSPDEALEIVLSCEDREFLEEAMNRIKECLENGETDSDEEGEET